MNFLGQMRLKMTDTTFKSLIHLLGTKGTVRRGEVSWVHQQILVKLGCAVRNPDDGSVRITAVGQEKFDDLHPNVPIVVRNSDLVKHKKFTESNLGLSYKVIGSPRSRLDNLYCTVAPFIKGDKSLLTSGYPTEIAGLRHLTNEEISVATFESKPLDDSKILPV